MLAFYMCTNVYMNKSRGYLSEPVFFYLLVLIINLTKYFPSIETGREHYKKS